MINIRYLGHSFFKISFPGRSILIDPYINKTKKDPSFIKQPNSFKRLIECPVTEASLKDISAILITHEHFDHFDKKAVETIALANNSKVVAHESILKQLSIPKNQQYQISRGGKFILDKMEISAVDAHHPQSFYPLGYLIKHDGTSVYHAGDTDLMDFFEDIEADVTILPIGGTLTMDVVDAVRAVKTMKPRYAIPMHYNTFEMIKADPREFKAKIEKSILKTEPVILKPGQNFAFK